MPGDVSPTPSSFLTQASNLLSVSNNTPVTFTASTEAAYSDFQFLSNVTDASLASLLGVSLSTLSSTDFIAFDTHGATTNEFESSDWSFSDGTTTLNHNHIFTDTANGSLLANNAISNAGTAYNAIFGTSFASNTTFGVLLFDLSSSGIDVNNTNFTATLTGGTILPNDPDITFLGTINTSAVPVPPAAWLFGSGLISLIGFSRRKNA